MPSFDLLLRRITPRYNPPVSAAPEMPVAPVAPVVVESRVEEAGFFRQALIDTRVQWARDVQRAAAQPSRTSAAVERVVFTDQYVPPPPRRPTSETDAVAWWD
jgi:hypothetical protein